MGSPDPVILQVTFAWHAGLLAWLPRTMLEDFGRPRRGFSGQGLATYSNWRQFGVETRLLPESSRR